MADPRTFTLIGEFKDGITPELERINRTLNSLKTSFSNLGGKGARNSSRDVGRLAVSIRTLNDTLKDSNAAFRSAIAPMREYRREVGKTVGAYKKLNEAGANARGLQDTNRALREQLRLLEQVRRNSGSMSAAQRGTFRRQSMGAMASGGGVRPGTPYTPRTPRDSGGGPGGFHMGEFGFALTLGNAIANPIQNAIAKGFDIGVGLMMKPFEHFQRGLGERVQDELSDLKAAGGMFAISREQEGKKFINSLQDAIDFTQENNTLLAKIAGSLPGSTQDYIEVSKRISDSIFRTVVTDQAASVKLAEKIRQSNPELYGREAIAPDTSPESMRKATQTILADLTTQTVLAGQGGRAGVGGTMGAYGLPQLTERMLSQDEVSMGQFQRYAAIFSDPMIMSALEKEIPEINKTSKNSAERIEALRNLYKRVLPPELVERYRRTFAGLTESIKTAITSPETGLFGLGRKMEGLGVRINEFGQYVDKNNKVVKTAAEAAQQSLSIFDMFRDVFVNIGQVLLPIIENMDLLWDPLRAIGLDLKAARDVTIKVLQSFNVYLNSFKNFAKTLNPEELKAFNKVGAPLRASVLTLGNILRYFKVFSEQDYGDLVKQLKDPNVDIGAVLKRIIDTFLNSEVANKIGNFFGTLISTVLKEVAGVTGFLSGRIKKSNELFAGLKAGFDEGGGMEAIKNIFKDVFSSLLKILWEVMKIIPFEGYIFLAAMAILPAAAQGLAMAFASGISRGIAGLVNLVPGYIGTKIANQGMAGAGGSSTRALAADRATRLRNAFVPAAFRQKGNRQQYTAPIGPTPAPRRDISTGQLVEKQSYLPSSAQPGTRTRGRAPRALIRQRNIFGSAARAMAKTDTGAVMLDDAARIGKGAKAAGRGVMGFGKGAMGVAKGIGKVVPGGALVMGGIDAALRMGAGQDAGKAIGGAAATTIGSTLGGILGQTLIPIPGVGAALGGVAGGILGDKLFTMLMPETQRQKEAADKQMEAARMQQEAANKDLEDRTKVDLGATGALVNDPAKLAQVLQYLDVKGPEADSLLQQAGDLNALSTTLKTTGDELNKMIAVYQDLGYSREQIVARDDYRALQDNYSRIAELAKTKSEKLKETFDKMPQETTKGIVTAMQKVDGSAITAALTAKINGAQPPQFNYNWNSMPRGIFDRTAPGASSPTPNAGINWFTGQPLTKPPAYGGSLGDAVAAEMKHKPHGSSLVVANSSETIIPAYGGLGMSDFMTTLRMGFAEVASLTRSANMYGGGETNMTNNITINTQPGQSSEDIAYAVLNVLQSELETTRATSLFV